jgi:hypothetical protein
VNTYSVFGGCLHSEIPLQALSVIDPAPARWSIVCGPANPPEKHQLLLGSDRVQAQVEVRMFRTEDGYRLEYDDTGTFDVEENGTKITWYPTPGAAPQAVEVDLLGRVLATALHASGVFCLHGSGVVAGGNGLAFLAPKHHGKSTLAKALTAAGALLASDDVLPIGTGGNPVMLPGTQHIRLMADSAGHLGTNGTVAAPGQKHLDMVPGNALLKAAVPLQAVYVLEPQEASTGCEPAVRTRLGPVPSILALIQNTTLGPLLGSGEAGVLLNHATELARIVPVYRLQILRGYQHLPHVVATLLSWSSGAGEPHA